MEDYIDKIRAINEGDYKKKMPGIKNIIAEATKYLHSLLKRFYKALIEIKKRNVKSKDRHYHQI